MEGESEAATFSQMGRTVRERRPLKKEERNSSDGESSNIAKERKQSSGEGDALEASESHNISSPSSGLFEPGTTTTCGEGSDLEMHKMSEKFGGKNSLAISGLSSLLERKELSIYIESPPLPVMPLDDIDMERTPIARAHYSNSGEISIQIDEKAI